MRYLKQLQNDLAYCVERQILSADSARAVVTAVAERQAPSPWRASLILGILSGACVVGGLALIVSHNWDKIPAFVKVMAFVALYFAVGKGAVSCEERSPRAATILQVLWLFMPLIGIGLYAQVFQLSGHPVRPFLVWLALIFPIVWIRPSPVAARVYVLASLGILFAFNFQRGNELTMTTGYSYSPSAVLWSAWAWSVGLWVIAHVVNRRFVPPGHQHVLWAGFGIWLVSLAMARTPFHFRGDVHFVILLASCSVAMLIATQALLRLPHRGFFWLYWVGSVYWTTFLWHSSLLSTYELSVPAITYASGLTLLSIVLILFLDREKDTIPPFWLRLWQGGLLASLVIPIVAIFAPNVIVIKAMALLANALLAGIGLALIGYGSRIGRASFINGGCAVIFLLIVTRFLDVFGSFVRSGIGMMMAGVLLAGLAFAMNRGRQSLVGATGKESL